MGTRQDAPAVVVFLTVSDYENINDMARACGDAFGRLGYRVLLIDTRDRAFPGNLLEAAQTGDVAFMFGINGVGLPREAGVAGYFDAKGIPYFSFFVDHPAYVHGHLTAPMEGVAYSFTSAAHVAFCRRLVGAGAPVIALPHAAAARPAAAPLPKAPSVFFAGSLFGDAQAARRAWGQSLGTDGAACAEAALDMYDAGDGRDLADMVLDAMGEGDLDADRTEPLFARMRAVDDYLRTTVKVDTVCALGPTRAVVAGRGWDAVGDLPEHVTRLGETPARRVLDMIDGASAVLNLLPRYYHSHERVFAAAAAARVPLSTPSPAIAEIFGEAGAVMLEGTATEAGARIGQLLTDENRIATMAAAAQAAWAQGHTWDHRAARIVACMHERFAVAIP